MSFRKILRGAGAAALVGAVALGALPAAAQEEPQERLSRMREAREMGSDDRSAARAEMQAARQQMREQRAQAVQQRQERIYAEAARAPEPRGGEWSRGDGRSATGAERAGRDWNRRDNTSNDWGQARAAQAQAEAEARQQAQRNRTYRDGRRDGSYGAGTRGGDYAHGYRDAVRGNRPGDGHHADSNTAYGRSNDSYAHGYRDARNGYRPNDGHHNWDRRWRSDNRYNWYGYRNTNRSLFSIGTYYSPYSSYRYSRLGIGYRLNSGFYSSRYWINDPWRYRLPAAYGPYRWIRYYDDALLVNVYTGQVEDVIYDFFW